MNTINLSNDAWLALGIIGQITFAARFVVQWIFSEYRRQSVMPMTFWYLSILGAAMLLAYSVHLRDPVFILGQAGGMLIYARNIQLRRREARGVDSQRNLP
ncbi:MAG: lipid-A-disaccharide synthase N-terminal domain-containing protein [Rhodanobacteraceae bacterium]